MTEFIANLHPVFNMTLETMQHVDWHLGNVTHGLGIHEAGAAVGLQPDQFKYIICLLMSYPLSIVHR